MRTPFLTGKEILLQNDEVIVSKTNTKGHITYCNDVFQKISGFAEKELIGKPHSIVRHPAMPRCVFKLLWDALEKGDEIFAYVVNRCKNGDHYWVFAHATPDFDKAGKLVGYNSFRRAVDASAINTVQPLYKALQEEEERHEDRKAGMQASFDMLINTMKGKGITYDQFILSL